jgi:mRNA interferase RelE/StbE
MEVKFTSIFLKDISGIHNNRLIQSIEESIVNAKGANAIGDIKKLKKLKGYSKHFRIRIGDYRIGLFIENNTIEFSRFLHRKDIYKYFP